MVQQYGMADLAIETRPWRLMRLSLQLLQCEVEGVRIRYSASDESPAVWLEDDAGRNVTASPAAEEAWAQVELAYLAMGWVGVMDLDAMAMRLLRKHS